MTAAKCAKNGVSGERKLIDYSRRNLRLGGERKKIGERNNLVELRTKRGGKGGRGIDEQKAREREIPGEGVITRKRKNR